MAKSQVVKSETLEGPGPFRIELEIHDAKHSTLASIKLTADHQDDLWPIFNEAAVMIAEAFRDLDKSKSVPEMEKGGVS